MRGREKMSFQENLKYYREKAGYKTAKELADALSIPYPTYVGYENKNSEPKYNTLCKIADLLNVSTDELLGRKNNILGMNEDDRLKKELDDILSISNTKFLKLHDINSGYVVFEICGNDENFISHASLRKKDLLGIIELIKTNSKKTEKTTLYEWIILIGIQNIINQLNSDINILKNNKVKKISKYEQTELINNDLNTIKELQELREKIYEKFPNSYKITPKIK